MALPCSLGMMGFLPSMERNPAKLLVLVYTSDDASCFRFRTTFTNSRTTKGIVPTATNIRPSVSDIGEVFRKPLRISL